MALDEFEDPKDFTEGMRPNNVEHFYGTTATGEKVGFITAIHKDANKPFRQRYLHRRSVDPLTKAETVGPKFFGERNKKWRSCIHLLSEPKIIRKLVHPGSKIHLVKIGSLGRSTFLQNCRSCELVEFSSSKNCKRRYKCEIYHMVK